MLVGRHDFTTFRSVHCQSDSPVKTLDRLDVKRVGEEIHIEAAARSFKACLSTAMIKAERNTRNCSFSCGVLPGFSRFSPSSVAIDQLLCLPEPLTPAKGFS